MKKLTRTLLIATAGLLWALSANAQAPVTNGVMLQGFYWNSYNVTDAKKEDGKHDPSSYGPTKWSNLSKEAEEISQTFDWIWLPPSANSTGGSGYIPTKWSGQDSNWGTSGDLKNLIKKFHGYGTKVIADIVINHRNNYTGSDWTKFATENFGDYGKSVIPDYTWVCNDDEARACGYTCSGPSDDGYEELNCECSQGKSYSAKGAYCSARDLAHSNTKVQAACRAYLKWMKNVMGYDGWRYDYCKGFHGSHIDDYNSNSGSVFSVGEYWDGNGQTLKWWLSECKKNTNVFDFNLKYDGLNNGLAAHNYGQMAQMAKGEKNGLLGDHKQYSVTFVDNHDTFRDNNEFGGNWTQACAYIIALPGTPCIFYPHWKMCKDDIKRMVAARKACGIQNTSNVNEASGNGSYYYCKITGTKGTLYCYIGSGWSAPSGYKWKFEDPGDGWAYYTTVPVDEGPSVTMNPTSGYTPSVTLSANKGTIYYTTKIGGTPDKPTASSTKYTGPIAVTSDKLYISAIAIDGTKQSPVETGGPYTNIKPKDITVQFKAPAAWTTVKAYAWVGKGETDAEKLLGAWPGTAIGKSGDKYSVTIDTNKATSFNIIFNNGATTDVGKQQTADLPITADACFDGSSLVYSGEPWPTPGKCQDGPSSITVRASTNNPAWSGDVYIHAWTGVDTNITEWPGVKMTRNGDWWTYTFTNVSTPINFLFNEGKKESGKQTDNIEGISSNACYNILSTTHEDAWGNQVYDTEETGCPVAADDIESVDGVTLVPNPTSGEMTILSDREFILGNVTTIGGKNCGSFEVNGNTIDVSRLAPNREPYLLRLVDSNGNVTVESFFRR